MPWGCHTGRVHKTIGDFGEMRRNAGSDMLDTFAAPFGGDAAEVVHGFAISDFNSLPDNR